MRTSYQAYLEVIENIKYSNLSKDEKSIETERATNERENGDTPEFIHRRLPPWSKT